MADIEEVRLRDKLERMSKQHALFIRRCSHERDELFAEKSRYEGQLLLLKERLAQQTRKQTELQDSLHGAVLKTSNLKADSKATARKLKGIQTLIESCRSDILRAEGTLRSELHALSEKEHGVHTQLASLKAQEAQLSEAAQSWARINGKVVQDCDESKRALVDALVIWLRLHPLLHLSAAVDDSLVSSHRKTAACQGLVREWNALRQLLHSFTLLADDYAPAPLDCHNILSAQQERLRHIARFCTACDERTAALARNSAQLEAALVETGELRTSLLRLLKDLSAAASQDLQAALKEAEAETVRPLSLAALAPAPAPAPAQPETNTAPPAHKHRGLKTWQWCRQVDVQHSAELETIQCTLNAAIDLVAVLKEVPPPPSRQQQRHHSGSDSDGGGGGGSPPSGTGKIGAASATAHAEAFTRAVLLGLETRRAARDVQWAAVATAHESSRRMMQAINRKGTTDNVTASASAEGPGSGAGGGVSGFAAAHEALSRYLLFAGYQATASHVALALRGHPFPCAPELLVHGAALAAPALVESEAAALREAEADSRV